MDTETTETVSAPLDTGAPDTQATSDEVVSISKAEYETLNQTLGSLKKEIKDLKKAPEKTERKSKSDELDYGMKAYLKSEGIEADHFGWVQEQRRESGLELETMLKNPYFQSQLKERRDSIAIKNAMPSETRGSGENPRTSVDYWIGKGELPPNTPENTQLRRDVVNKRVQTEQIKQRFSSTPIVNQ